MVCTLSFWGSPEAFSIRTLQPGVLRMHLHCGLFKWSNQGYIQQPLPLLLPHASSITQLAASLRASCALDLSASVVTCIFTVISKHWQGADFLCKPGRWGKRGPLHVLGLPGISVQICSDEADSGAWVSIYTCMSTSFTEK